MTNQNPTAPALGTGARSLRLSDHGIAKLLLFAAAGLSFLASVYLFFSGDRERGIFVGLWVPSICSAGALLMAGGRRDV